MRAVNSMRSISNPRARIQSKTSREKPYEARYKVNLPDFRGMAQVLEEQNNESISKLLSSRREGQKSQTRTPPPVQTRRHQSKSDLTWIQSYNTMQPLKSARQRPARFQTLVRPNVPKFKEMPQQRYDDAMTEPQRELPRYQYPALQSTKDIMNFDVWTDKRTPEEWAEYCRFSNPPHAQVPIFVNGEYIWDDVEVIDYNSNIRRFSVENPQKKIQKLVNRLSIRFKEEDFNEFEERVRQAKHLQAQFKQQTRYLEYLDDINDKLISVLSMDTKAKILNRAIAGQDRFKQEQFIELLRELTQVVDFEYKRAMKQCIINRRMMDPDNDREFKALKIPIKRQIEQVPYLGTLTIPEHDFKRTTKWIKENHWYKHRSVVKVNKTLSHKCYSFLENTFLTDVGFQYPLELNLMYKIQHSHLQQMKQQILIHWREHLIGETQDLMSDNKNFNFFAVETESYWTGDLHWILRRLDFIMNSYIQRFSKQSIDHWVGFLQKFQHPPEGQCWLKTSKPLLILHLHAQSKPKKDQTEQADPPGTINFRPRIERAINFFSDCINWIADSTSNILTLECDLVPFMNLPKQASFQLPQSHEWILDAKNQLKELFDFYSEGPIQLYQDYKQFEWITTIDIKKYIKKLFKKKPTIEQLRECLSQLSDNIYKVNTISTHYVDFDFFRIQCDSLQNLIKSKAKKCIDLILHQISQFCSEEVTKIHIEYQQICDNVLKLPNNEEELFELKTYARSIPSLKQNLLERENDITNHTYILEDYLFPLDLREYAKLFNCKTWPFEIDASTKDGLQKLEEQEEKFREKLEEEKIEWNTFVEQLKEDFMNIQMYSDYNNYMMYYDDIKRLEAGLKEAMQKLVSFNQRETLFELPLSSRKEMQKMIDDFGPFNKLWTNTNEFRYNFQRWMEQICIQDLESGDMAAKTDLWYRECFMLNKKLLDKSPEAVNVIGHLKSHLEEFNLKMPLIKSLSNEALTEDHWIQLTNMCGLDTALDPKVETVQSLISKGMHLYIDQIEELSHRAQREFKLKQKLEQMKSYCDEIQLEILPYKDTFVIRTIEDIQTILDEQIVNVQAMKTSPYVKPIEHVCKDWEQKLQLVQETLDEWIKCQQVWINLEPIFGSDDIQKQIPVEHRKFRQIDSMWKVQMDSTNKEPALFDCVGSDTLTNFQDANQILDEIQKGLNNYLETKRLSFPRFYFLSDEDLLDILSQTKDPLKVNNHLNKCFEAIETVIFTDDLQITTMISPEDERIMLFQKVTVDEGDKKGNVELWMSELEDMMFYTVKDFMYQAFLVYNQTKRSEWVLQWPAQAVLCINKLIWTQKVEKAIESKTLEQYENYLWEDLKEIIGLVRQKQPRNVLKLLGALVTLDVHSRDIVTNLKTQNITNSKDFEWVSQMRYYYQKDNEILVQMVNSDREYKFEYLGNSSRLVITPLTDRCYRTLIGAYSSFFGGAPEGPAGTGKTESVKDLAKAIGVKCVVFNCSDNLNYKAMAKFFKGLASSGSWCCFDEFNRIESEVLSVVAMQLLQIQSSIRERKGTMTFDGTIIKLRKSCAVNITMNPGYAGRQDLPDNLKALFRPCAMMVPNYALISEISLLSYGYYEARVLAEKLVSSLKLSSELLSTQDHYDFGMRAVKAILTACGNLKMRFQDNDEHLLALRALNDVNLPKFTSNDIPLFLGIISDLFPNVDIPEISYGKLNDAIENCSYEENILPVKSFKGKCIQLYETLLVRHGLMLVGATFSGKTKVINTVQQSISSIIDDSDYQMVQKKVINPKSITSNQLYGSFNAESHEWTEGVLAQITRQFSTDKSADRKWIVFDGPVDAMWIENMNTVLDDNKMLCLSSGEIIKLSQTMTMIFEVENLKSASPATVSRCGMVYLEQEALGWHVLVNSYVLTLPHFIQEAQSANIKSFFKWFCQPLVEFVGKKCRQQVTVTSMELVWTSLGIFDCFMKEYRDRLKVSEVESPVKVTDFTEQTKLPADFDQQVRNFILFSIVWGFGGSLDNEFREGFEEFLQQMIQGQDVREQFQLINLDPKWTPMHFESVSYQNFFESVYVQSKGEYEWTLWINLKDEIDSKRNLLFHELIIPTKETIRVSHLLNMLAESNKHVLFTGPTGTGKTITILNKLQTNFDNEHFTYLYITFSARTSANQTQMIIDGVLERKKRNTYWPPGNKQMILFVDDLNMPEKEPEGAQPPIELLRQWMDYGGWYDLNINEFRYSQFIQFVGSMQPPTGGRNSVTQRYLRHYHKFYCDSFDSDSLSLIYNQIMHWFYDKQEDRFSRQIIDLKDKIVLGTIKVYQSTVKELLPTPNKSHYLYNLRDISRVFQGISQVVPQVFREEDSFIKLWGHECMRVFQDRLVDQNDRLIFENILQNTVDEVFKKNWSKLTGDFKLLFCDFIPMNTEQGQAYNLYHQVQDFDFLKGKMEEFLEFFNQISPIKMNLVLFMDAIEQITKIVRILKQPFGNAFLVGVGGSGRKSLSMLASCILEYSLAQIEVTKSFSMSDWHDQLKKIIFQAGLDDKSTVFIISDNQIAKEAFLEDINSIINIGEVPNLMDTEDKSTILEAMKDVAIQYQKALTPDSLFKIFVDRVKANLHMVLCFSPIGESFRTRLRNFPSLVNCTTINWFLPWPQEALEQVATSFVSDLNVTENFKPVIIQLFVQMQENIRSLSSRFKTELGRYYYVTPTSYLELLNIFSHLLNTKRSDVWNMLQRYQQGLEKLETTGESVSKMQQDLRDLEPKLLQSQEQTKEMMKDLNVQQEEARQIQEQCEAEELRCKEEADKASFIKKECEDKLEAAMPAYHAALAALKSLTKNDISEVKSMTMPPPGVRFTMEAMCVLLGVPPMMVPKEKGFGKEPDYWETAKRNILNRPRLITDLQNFDKDNIDMDIIDKIAKIVKNSEFAPEKIRRSSKAAHGLSMWVRAMFEYDKIIKEIRPKRAALQEATEKLKEAEDDLAVKKQELQRVYELVEKLQQDYDNAVQTEQEYQRKVDECRLKLQRAQKIIDGLRDEKTRWSQAKHDLSKQDENLIGDLIVSAGVIAYLGVFPASYREECIQLWEGGLLELGILVSDDYQLMKILGDDILIRDWLLSNLPNDTVSIENCIIMQNSSRWPLMIDPQLQANKWLKTYYKDKIDVTRLNSDNLINTLVNSINFGRLVLIENIGEEVSQELENLLSAHKGEEGYIKIGDQTAELSKYFLFFMTTKLPKPHYSPEICVRVTLLDFTTTEDGLLDQMLALVVYQEAPHIENSRLKGIQDTANCQKQLKRFQDDILELLSSAQGDILEDEALIETLSNSKEASKDIQEQLEKQENIQKNSNETRKNYRPVAFRVSRLFFCVSDLSNVEPMYQYSLQWYEKIFLKSIAESEKAAMVQERIKNLIQNFTLSLYTNICRSIFEKDKLLFSLLICIKLLQADNMISHQEIRFLMTGGTWTKCSRQNPTTIEGTAPWLNDKEWAAILELSELENYQGFSESFEQNVNRWRAIWESQDPFSLNWPDEWKDKLNQFQQILILRILRPDRVVMGIEKLIMDQMGESFVNPPSFNLDISFKDSDINVPMIFILSSGVDPIQEIEKFATKSGYKYRAKYLSLGEGQGQIAEGEISRAIDEGGWVILQNCHLATSWMPVLEKIVEEIDRNTTRDEFRLWLTSCSSSDFPVSILQAGVKITNEPPKGIKQNLLRTYLTLDSQFYDECPKSLEWKRLLYGLSFFHALVQERRKFGALGWNIYYEFSMSDFYISAVQLKTFLTDYEEIPWKALNYMVSQANYGGRVTDKWDVRTIRTILQDFYTPDILENSYRIGNSNDYPIPKDDNLIDTVAYLREVLPHNDEVQVFGLHQNAAITSAINDTNQLLQTCLSLLPRTTGKAEKTSDQIITEKLQDIESRMPDVFDIEAISKKYPITTDQSMNTVLIQELLRYNKLIQLINYSTRAVKDAILGLVIMTSDLEEVYNSTFDNKVPGLWSQIAYPSLKPLGFWLNDLINRVRFMQDWIDRGTPSCFWISGFYFTQSFLTGIMQNYSRKYKIAIDTLKFDFEVLPESRTPELLDPPEDGAYISGLYLDGGRWDENNRQLSDPLPKILYYSVPVIWLKPIQSKNFVKRHTYNCPVYKTSKRQGQLSTTGQSTNFILSIKLPMAPQDKKSHWIKRGCAMLTQLDYQLKMDNPMYESLSSNESQSSRPKSSRWNLVRNVFRAVHLFKTHEANIRHDIDELVHELQAIPSDLHYKSRRYTDKQQSPFQIALDDFRREQRIFEYIERGGNTDLDQIKLEIEQDPYRFLRQASHPLSIVNKPGKDGKTPLYCACVNGNLEVVKYLAEVGVDHLIESDIQGEKDTPLEVAARWGYLPIVEVLLQKFKWPKRIKEKALKSTKHPEIEKILKDQKRKKFLCCFC